MQQIVTKNRRRPTFLFIGPGRAGSSWFHEILREHPEVFVPPNKGTFFFSQHYRKGLAWYEPFFAGARQPVVGEVCEDYLATAGALARAKDYDPGIRLICCLRNPYERALSSWRFFARNGRDLPTLAAQVQRDPWVCEQGCYATQLQIARSLFGDDQILIFMFEELASNPRSVARRLYRFIGANPEFVPQSLHQRVNGSSRPRSRLLAGLVHDVHLHSWGTSRIVSNTIGQIKRVRPLRRLVQTALYAEGSHSENWRELLAEFPEEMVTLYEREISALEQMLGRDLSSWHAKSPSGSASRSSADSCRP